MYEYRQIIFRLRQGESIRSLSNAKLGLITYSPYALKVD